MQGRSQEEPEEHRETGEPEAETVDGQDAARRAEYAANVPLDEGHGAEQLTSRAGEEQEERNGRGNGQERTRASA